MRYRAPGRDPRSKGRQEIREVLLFLVGETDDRPNSRLTAHLGGGRIGLKEASKYVRLKQSDLVQLDSSDHVQSDSQSESEVRLENRHVCKVQNWATRRTRSRVEKTVLEDRTLFCPSDLKH